VKPFPDGFSSWDHVVIDKGNLSVEEFVAMFPQIHHNVQLSLLYKAGITQDDIATKKAAPLYAGGKRPLPALALQMLKKVDLSANHRAKFQQQVDDAEKYNAEVEQKLKMKLIDLYVSLHGPLITASRNYVLLHGAFKADGCDEAEVPLIKYIFKH